MPERKRTMATLLQMANQCTCRSGREWEGGGGAGGGAGGVEDGEELQECLRTYVQL